jgi:DNA/RNA-binding domain of Phe-tRNA-synthetase-like protein
VELLVHPQVFERLPGMRIAVALARGVDNGAAHPEVAARWAAAWRAAGGRKADLANAQSHPNVRAWREAFRAMGVSPHDFPSSIEALLRRAMKGGPPFSINPLVDLYNAISLERVAPVGAFDVGGLGGPLELRLTRDGDVFVALDRDEPLAVPPGEVAYAVGCDVLTRHLLWRQSRRALVTPATRDALLLSEALPASPEPAEALVEDFRTALAAHFDAIAVSTVIDAGTPSFIA